MLKTLSFIPFAYLSLLLSLTGLQVTAQTTATADSNVDIFIKDASIWKMDQKQIATIRPHLQWKKAKLPGEYICWRKDMLLWDQPVKQLLLKLNTDTNLARVLSYKIITEKLAKEMPQKQIIADIVKWRTLISKKLQIKSVQISNRKSGNKKINRIAWVHKDYIVTLIVFSQKKITNVDLAFHERKEGFEKLGLKDTTGSDSNKKVTPKPETSTSAKEDSTEETISSVSRASTPSIQKKYDIKENFDADWPKLIKASSPEITIIKEDDEENVFIYHSPNFEFVCDVKISTNIIKNFSTLFEATRSYCQEIPLSMVKAHMPEDTLKFKILLFETKESYYKNGGPPGSAGVYMSGSGVIMVPLSGLGVKKVGSGYMFDYKATNKTLPHEITHQLTNTEYFASGARGWFSEGLAEYIAVTDYRSGKFMVNGNLTEIRRYVTDFSRKDGRGRNLGDEFSAPDLKKFMLMSYGEFTANGNFNYGLGALITYYFLHMDKDGERKNIVAFLTALNAGKEGEEALKALLAGRTFDELEEQIHKAWRSRGVKINFR